MSDEQDGSELFDSAGDAPEIRMHLVKDGIARIFRRHQKMGTSTNELAGILGSALVYAWFKGGGELDRLSSYVQKCWENYTSDHAEEDSVSITADAPLPPSSAAN